MSASEQGEGVLVCRRSERRFPVVLPVRVWGVDSSGHAFSQPASTLVISLNGSRLDGIHVPLAPGDVVGVQYGMHKGRFRVIWVGAPNGVREGQVGVWCTERDKHLFGNESAEVEELAASQTEVARVLAAPEGAPERAVERRQGERRREERRMHPRHQCDGGAEIRKQGVDARVWGTLADISLGGCYVEMMTPFPSGTEVEVIVAVAGSRLRAGAVVGTCHAGCGMGVRFTEMSEDDRAQLQQIINSLAESASKPIEPPRPVPAPATLASSPDGSPTYSSRVLQGILAFFGEREVLTRREFQEILGRAKSASGHRDPGAR
ncbi:MAG: PilZ domain-containing protein [Acidobacteria bacterium]|nr:PilZ domain-containing protein [Acidobacteriota bacterium]